MSKLNRRELIQAGLISGSALAFFTGCEAVEAGANLGLQAAGLSTEQADSLIEVGKKVAKTFEDFTPEQEYYLGRTVAANIFSKYSLYKDDKRTEYVHLVGLHLAQSSDQPETFGGYHFAILDSGEVNAFAAPGGFIFVTRGMLECCPHEDALSAVLAHEIAHVHLKHGLKAINKSRIADVFASMGSEALSHLTPAELDNIVNLFSDSVNDITDTMINNGYSRTYEFEADKLGVKIMGQAGYLNRGMADMLSKMGERLKPGGTDFAKTHPSPKSRLEALASSIDMSARIPTKRTQRFRKNIG